MINDANTPHSALREICEITEIADPRLAMQHFTLNCATVIQNQWIPFWHFRTFWTHELSPKHIISPAVGNRAYRNHRISMMVTVEDVEAALGIENLRKQIMPIHSFSQSIAVQHVTDGVLNDELSVIDVGAIVSIFDTFNMKMEYQPDVIIQAGKCCLGMVLANKIAQAIF